jgi:hypothetical protein
MSELDRWAEAVREELGLACAPFDPRLVLDLARDVAHRVDRPAAPLTAYLLGLAVAQGHAPEAAAARISALTASWAGQTADGR